MAVKKPCTKCKIEYPATLDYFHKHTSNKDNLYTWCKSCEKIRCSKNKKLVFN